MRWLRMWLFYVRWEGNSRLLYLLNHSHVYCKSWNDPDVVFVGQAAKY